MPEGLPLRRRPRRNWHVFVMKLERVLTLGNPDNQVDHAGKPAIYPA